MSNDQEPIFRKKIQPKKNGKTSRAATTGVEKCTQLDVVPLVAAAAATIACLKVCGQGP